MIEKQTRLNKDIAKKLQLLSHYNFQEKLKWLLKEIKLKKIAPFLSLYPVIPYESIFREVFGNNAINDIYNTE